MSLSLEPVEPQADVAAQAASPRRRLRRPVILGVLAAIAALAVFGLWLASGLKSAAAAIKAPAAQARTELTTMKTALQAGDQAQARAALSSAEASLRTAETAAGRAPVRIAGFIPILSEPVSDLRHLLSAARDLVTGGGLVVDLYEDVSGKDSKLFRDAAFDLDAVRGAGGTVRTLMGLLDKAEADLKDVRGGRLAPGAAEARDSALTQIAGLRTDAKPLVDILGVLPKALGETSPQCYLVTLQNQAELRAGGGAPLSITSMCFDKGAIQIQPAQATFDVSDENAAIQWEPVAGNEAWHVAGERLPFASANKAPDWPTSGEELLRAYEVMSKTRAIGVIGIDVTAMAAVLRATGTSLSTPGYGDVNSETLAQTLLIDSYLKFDNSTRRKNNQELMAAMVQRLIGGGQLAGKFRALAGTSSGHHMQMYFRDKDLQSLVQPTAMAGRLDPGKGDFSAVYTTNTNASKVDVYQDRSITQDVSFEADGSAKVVRTVTISNNSPGYRGAYKRDLGKGADSTFSRPSLALYTPPGAKITGFEVTGSAQATIGARSYVKDKNMWVLKTAPSNLPRVHSMTATVSYTTRANPALDGYRLRVASQAILRPATMTVNVVVPKGYTATGAPGWTQQGERWTTTLSVTGDVDIALPFARG